MFRVHPLMRAFCYARKFHRSVVREADFLLRCIQKLDSLGYISVTQCRCIFNYFYVFDWYQNRLSWMTLNGIRCLGWNSVAFGARQLTLRSHQQILSREMTSSTPTKHDGRAVLFAVAELFVIFSLKRKFKRHMKSNTVLQDWQIGYSGWTNFVWRATHDSWMCFRCRTSNMHCFSYNFTYRQNLMTRV